MQILTGLFDHMVLQRSRRNVSEAAFSGIADNGGTLLATVKAGTKTLKGFVGIKIGIIRRGKFRARLGGMPVGGPYTINLSIQDNTGKAIEMASVKDVLVGDVWILGGQSNMQGLGDRENGLKCDASVRAFFMDDHWGVAQEPIHDLSIAVAPVHVTIGCGNRQTAAGRYCAGPGLPFALRMKQINGVPQGIIACAHGGTRMTQWDPALRKKGGNSLYGAMIRRVVKNGGKVAGMIWYQRESDATPEAAPLFTGKMKKFVAAVRRDSAFANIPFVQVQLSHVLGLSDNTSRNSIQEQQRCLPRVIKNFLTVPSIDVAMDDGYHVSGDGAVVLGERLTQAMDVLCRGTGAGKPPIELKNITIEKEPDHTTANVVVEFANVAGKLQAAGRPNGFTLAGTDGFAGTGFVFDIKLNGPCAIVRTTRTAEQLRAYAIHYGFGTNPFCNITDVAGRSLPVFGPFMLGKTRAATKFVREIRVSRLQPGAGNLTSLNYPNINVLELEKKHFSDNICNMHPLIAAAGQADRLLYYVCDIDCAEDMRLGALLGYDGPIKLWIDGIGHFHDPNGTNPALQDAKTVKFKATAGKHQIVIALGTNHGAAWGIFLRFERFDVSPAKIKAGPEYYKLPCCLG
jgi:sialate O-acetylesterase